MNLRTTVQIFTKYPHVGRVKTRLAAKIGFVDATQVHCELVDRQLRELMRLPCSFRLELWCTENADETYNRCLFERWPRLRYCRQYNGDLGQRLALALKQSAAHSNRILQIGTDCPVLQSEHIRHAAESLLIETDSVFIPAEDGGYVLGGYSRYRAGIFDNIEWSSPRVLSQALSRLHSLGMTTATLPTLWDIDHVADLDRYRLLQGGTLE